VHTIAACNSLHTARPITPAQEWYPSDGYLYRGVAFVARDLRDVALAESSPFWVSFVARDLRDVAL
jgi:hypothetical protein